MSQISAEKHQLLISLILKHAADQEFTTPKLFQTPAIKAAGFSRSSIQQILQNASQQGEIILIGSYRITPKAAPTKHYRIKAQAVAKPPQQTSKKDAASARSANFIWNHDLETQLYRGLMIPLHQYAIHQHRMKDSQR
jgi:hypothetical protein